MNIIAVTLLHQLSSIIVQFSECTCTCLASFSQMNVSQCALQCISVCDNHRDKLIKLMAIASIESVRGLKIVSKL